MGVCSTTKNKAKPYPSEQSTSLPAEDSLEPVLFLSPSSRNPRSQWSAAERAWYITLSLPQSLVLPRLSQIQIYHWFHCPSLPDFWSATIVHSHIPTSLVSPNIPHITVASLDRLFGSQAGTFNPDNTRKGQSRTPPRPAVPGLVAHARWSLLSVKRSGIQSPLPWLDSIPYPVPSSSIISPSHLQYFPAVLLPYQQTHPDLA